MTRVAGREEAAARAGGQNYGESESEVRSAHRLTRKRLRARYLMIRSCRKAGSIDAFRYPPYNLRDRAVEQDGRVASHVTIRNNRWLPP